MILWLDFKKLVEMLFFGQKWPFFDENRPKTTKLDFSVKIRKYHFRRIRKPQRCAKIRKSYERILRSLPDGWTNEQTNGRTDERTDEG